MHYGGAVQTAMLGQGEQRVVGDAAPQKERETGGEIQVAEAIDGAGRAARRIALNAEQEVRGNQDGSQRLFDATIEIAFAATGTIEGHERTDVGISNRAAESAATYRGQNPARARLFVTRGGRAAHKQPGAAGRFAAATGVVGAGDEDIIHSRRQVARVRHFKTFHPHAIQAHIHLGRHRWNGSGGRRDSIE